MFGIELGDCTAAREARPSELPLNAPPPLDELHSAVAANEPCVKDAGEAAAKALKAKAALMFKEKDFEQALAHCDEAIAIQPLEATHRANRSLALLRLGRPAAAAAAAEDAIACRPLWAKAHFRLGHALRARAAASAGMKTAKSAVAAEAAELADLRLALRALDQAAALQQADHEENLPSATADAATRKVRVEVAIAVKRLEGRMMAHETAQQAGAAKAKEDPEEVDAKRGQQELQQQEQREYGEERQRVEAGAKATREAAKAKRATKATAAGIEAEGKAAEDRRAAAALLGEAKAYGDFKAAEAKDTKAEANASCDQTLQ